MWDRDVVADAIQLLGVPQGEEYTPVVAARLMPSTTTV